MDIVVHLRVTRFANGNYGPWVTIEVDHPDKTHSYELLFSDECEFDTVEKALECGRKKAVSLVERKYRGKAYKLVEFKP